MKAIPYETWESCEDLVWACPSLADDLSPSGPGSPPPPTHTPLSQSSDYMRTNQQTVNNSVYSMPTGQVYSIIGSLWERLVEGPPGSSIPASHLSDNWWRKRVGPQHGYPTLGGTPLTQVCCRLTLSRGQRSG